MDVLGLLFSKAEEAGLLQQLSRRRSSIGFLYMQMMWLCFYILLLKKLLSRQQFQPFVERIADQLPN
jgi:hypothetical protein